MCRLRWTCFVKRANISASSTPWMFAPRHSLLHVCQSGLPRAFQNPRKGKGSWMSAVYSAPSNSPGTSPEARSAFLLSMNAGPKALFRLGTASMATSGAAFERFLWFLSSAARVGLVEDEGDLLALHASTLNCIQIRLALVPRPRHQAHSAAELRFMTTRTSASKARTS